MENEEKTEGWQEEKHCGQRKYHYIVSSSALCRKLGFYRAELMPWTGKAKSHEDCVACYKLAEKRHKTK